MVRKKEGLRAAEEASSPSARRRGGEEAINFLRKKEGSKTPREQFMKGEGLALSHSEKRCDSSPEERKTSATAVMARGRERGVRFRSKASSWRQEEKGSIRLHTVEKREQRDHAASLKKGIFFATQEGRERDTPKWWCREVKGTGRPISFLTKEKKKKRKEERGKANERRF